MEINLLSNRYQQPDATTKSASQGSAFAELFNANLITQSAHKEAAHEPSGSVLMDTNKGQQDIDLAGYFSSEQTHTGSSLHDVPLLLPTQHNVDTLAQYSEQAFKQLLEEYNIPSPPATVEFDAQGQLLLPSDYPYAGQLKQAFAEKPQVQEALRTTAALASHYAGLMEAMAYQTEMLAAKNKAEEARITDKYSYLFDDNRAKTQIVLSFSSAGDMLIAGRNMAGEQGQSGQNWPF